ncbi:MAG: FAD-binding protein [Oscillospiraceae bacterium]|jgi:succinate dehydrogenase/fumarate reductase flavoprotein subunit|nr:FAD-binding protein [Oscillospiraceae bacterium]
MKKRITALTLACLMVMGTVAAAAGVEKTISVTPMTLNVNGQVVTPTKSDGTPAEVFAYEGTTYAPLRYLTELNGNQVVWDANDPNTAKITTGGLTYADTIAWDGQYDVVVAGFGGAGAVAASTAADAGAKVLLVEKAPEGHEGGNTRYCGQLFVYGDGNEEATLAYYKALAADREIPETMLQLYTKNIAHMYDVMEKLTGISKSGYVDCSSHPFVGPMSPEYPEFPGSDHITLNTLHEGFGDGFLWQSLRSLVTDRADSIDVWFESPAIHLIQDPVSKTILGVQIDRDGKTVNIRANNGVILTTGGFENNQQMIETYLDMSRTAYLGSGYNTGDGINMAMEVGAALWHMDVYEGGGAVYGATSFKVNPGERTSQVANTAFMNGSVLFLASDGSRYLREDAAARHGHIYDGGTWRNPNYSIRNFVFYDKVQASVMDSAIPDEFKKDIIKANTLSELAKLTGMDEKVLTDTISSYNSFVKNGKDLAYGRAPETMTAISNSGPYYAIEVIPSILNTQGGPQRNENAEVLDVNGNPIPHLYSAGELGGICAYHYQGGGNIAECVIFGQIAGKNAAAAKSDAPASLVKAASNLVYTPGKVSDLGGNGPDVSLSTNEYLGVSHNAMGGDLHVKVTMKDGKIAKVEVLENKETPGIGTKAIDAIPDAIVKANSVEVDNVSGATITSKAIKEAVADALSQVK